MYRHKILEEDENSLSLHQNTLIQQYNNLDSSQDLQDSDQKQEKSISDHNLHQLYLKNANRSNSFSQKEPFNNYFADIKSIAKRKNQPENKIQMKYQLDISPDTKEETEIFHAAQHPPSKNKTEMPFQLRKSHIHVGEYHDSYQNSEISSEDKSQKRGYLEDSRERSNTNALRKQQKHASNFNINSFLNAQPLPLHNKKGQKIFQERSNKIAKSKLHQEEQSLTLITLPEIEKENQIKKMKLRDEEENRQTETYVWRMKEARLNFIDTFMPEGLKIKNNPYNLLKYINSKKY